MPMPIELDHCPLTPECAAKKLFQDRETGKLYQYDKRNSDFKEHKCTVFGTVSSLPKYVYVGVWKNLRTGRTRYNGPFRMKSSAMNPPPDGGGTRRRKHDDRKVEWELVELMRSTPEWESVKDTKNE